MTYYVLISVGACFSRRGIQGSIVTGLTVPASVVVVRHHVEEIQRPWSDTCRHHYITMQV